MRKTLDQWLAFLESNHPTEIDMGLARVNTVAQRLDLLTPAPLTLLVAGTNGKGSTVTMCASILNSNGLSVGSYMSPHLHKYNERVRIDGQPVSDAQIIESFEAIDQARGEISLTYFEVGTLSALYIFKQCAVQAAVLEIGLGGRLDAVNIVQPNGAAVTSIGLDHQDWLGSDINTIAFEKAGVYRANQPAVCGQRDVPIRLIEHAENIGAHLLLKGRDFDFEQHDGHWSWQGRDAQGQTLRFNQLHLPSLPLENAATALQLLLHVCPDLSIEHINQGLANARLEGRLQPFEQPFSGIMDVGHNPQAACLLNDYLAAHPIKGRRFALLAMLKDKDAAAVVSCFDQIDQWHLAGLAGYRGQSAEDLQQKVATVLGCAGSDQTVQHETVAHGLDALTDKVSNDDQVIVFGSFITVAHGQRWLEEQVTATTHIKGQHNG